MLFSERHNYRKVREAIQIEVIDELARNRIWTIYHKYIFRSYRNDFDRGSRRVRGSNLERLIELI